MQEPGCSKGPPPSSKPLRKRRQKRTVYSAEQRQELEEVFESNRYPMYQDRETLAARLNLQEHQVQVWFKNRRAKHSRLLGRSKCQGAEAGNAPQGPGASAPAPAPVSPVFPEDSVFPEGLGFSNPPPSTPFGVYPAAEPNITSHSQAWWNPAQGAQKMIPTAHAPTPVPAQAPVWPQGGYASDFSPDSILIHDFTELPSLQDLLEGPSSPSKSEYQEGDGPRTLLNL